MTNQRRLSRRMFFGGGIGVAGIASGLLALSAEPKVAHATSAITNMSDITDIASMSSKAAATLSPFAGLPFMDPVDPLTIGFDPSHVLIASSQGKVTKLPSGQTQREYTLNATNKSLLVASGQQFAGLAYNDQVPGPTLRATQGDHIRITINNKSDAPHGLHLTGTRLGAVDTLTQPIAPGNSMVYEFNAEPFGLYLYQGFTLPLTPNVFKGLYGMLIVDPPQPRPKALELFMMLNGFVFGPVGQTPPGLNDLYAVNTVAYHYVRHPIPIPVNQLVRVYLVNVTQFDVLNSFHLHGNMFNIYRSGTSLKPDESNATILLAPAQRAILEFTFTSAGQYMFHSYQGEFANLGYMGIFNV
ncbi:MAG TPA: multicopper oxidase domain-containing protein, partial [Ktedonobacteraceae bacterium]|nr:multicopper oxidase domain-containing protein [Ktedonobacteraceae bacterium]